ncbi:hypothetical protein C8R45DRAFT_1027696 [Mycena sanguinolenta]|nr:hypothetical protein C8R45DRAFT_1027696 [Mycena sanguinolenta]
MLRSGWVAWRVDPLSIGACSVACARSPNLRMRLVGGMTSSSSSDPLTSVSALASGIGTGLGCWIARKCWAALGIRMETLVCDSGVFSLWRALDERGTRRSFLRVVTLRVCCSWAASAFGVGFRARFRGTSGQFVVVSSSWRLLKISLRASPGQISWDEIHSSSGGVTTISGRDLKP